MTADRSVLFGVPIDGYTMPETMNVVDELVRTGRSQRRTFQVTTVNVDFLVNAIKDPHVLTLLQDADLNLADGMPVLWASRLLQTPLPERVAGADLVPRLAEESAARGWRVHLFGARPGVALSARTKMLRNHAGAQITADSGPAMVSVDEPDDAVIDSIRRVEADVLCVALGNPKQERFISTYRSHLGCPVLIGIGGSLDMLIGDKRRAPAWAQQTGTEWLFRAAQEPKRLGRRYAYDISVFGPHLISYVRTAGRYRNGQHLAATTTAKRLRIVRSIEGPDASAATTDMSLVAAVEVDFTDVSALAPQAHAWLLGVIRDARTKGIPTSLRHVSDSLRSCLESYGTWNLLAETLKQS